METVETGCAGALGAGCGTGDPVGAVGGTKVAAAEAAVAVDGKETAWLTAVVGGLIAVRGPADAVDGRLLLEIAGVVVGTPAVGAGLAGLGPVTLGGAGEAAAGVLGAGADGEDEWLGPIGSFSRATDSRVTMMEGTRRGGVGVTAGLDDSSSSRS